MRLFTIIDKETEGHTGGVQFHKPLGCMSGYSHPSTGSHQTHNNAPKYNKSRDDTKSVT